MAEVASRVGFSNPAYFSKVFRTRMKLSPREYQKQGALKAAQKREGARREGGLASLFSRGRPCACFAPQEDGGPLPLLVLCGWGMEEKLPSLSQELPPACCFSPGPKGTGTSPPGPRRRPGGGGLYRGAGAYLEFLTEAALPCLEREYGASPRPEGRGILGYSLGGLFALWAQAQSGAFQTAGPCPGLCGTRAG